MGARARQPTTVVVASVKVPATVAGSVNRSNEAAAMTGHTFVPVKGARSGHAALVLATEVVRAPMEVLANASMVHSRTTPHVNSARSAKAASASAAAAWVKVDARHETAYAAPS